MGARKTNFEDLILGNEIFVKGNLEVIAVYSRKYKNRRSREIKKRKLFKATYLQLDTANFALTFNLFTQDSMTSVNWIVLE